MLGPLLAVAFALGWALFYRYRAESLAESLPYYSGAERWWVRACPVVMTVHVTLGSFLVSLAHPTPLRALAAAAVFAAAAVYWLRARAQIGPVDIPRLPSEVPRELRQDGAFAVVRHPMYFAYLVAAAVPLVAAPRPLLFVTFGACAVAIAVRAVQEERRLRAQLGTPYAAYCARVKRLIPFVW